VGVCGCNSRCLVGTANSYSVLCNASEQVRRQFPDQIQQRVDTKRWPDSDAESGVGLGGLQKPVGSVGSVGFNTRPSGVRSPDEFLQNSSSARVETLVRSISIYWVK